MSLATRCTACGTIFRIVEDQLRVSDGWVRCGRCAEIFDARELLFDIERDAPPPWPPAFAPAPPVEPPQPPASPPAMPPEPPSWLPPEPAQASGDALPTGWPTEEPRREPRWVDAIDPGEATLPPAPPALPEPPPMAAEPAAAPAAVVPEFMRNAQRSARWNRPAVRLALALVSLLLGLTLVLQFTLHFRDSLAARHPALRGPLQALCGAIGCEIKPWRHVEALGIESSSLAPAGAGNSYKLSLVISNKTSVEVAAPWIDLVLLDANGAPLARRAFPPDALSPPIARLPAASEQPLTLTFSTGSQAVNGFKAEAFYP